MNFDEQVAELSRKVDESVVASKEACEAMAAAAEEITILRAHVSRLERQNDDLRRENGKLRLLGDIKSDVVSIFHQRQAE